MSSYGPAAPVIFYDQSSSDKGHKTFDDLHLPQKPVGFSAYPLADRLDDDTIDYPSTRPQRARSRGISERTMVIVLTLIAAFTKLYRIGRRDNVSWDEAHFGKFGAYYLNRTFYHDVHPPLAKMLVGFSELLAGHNGTFDFKGGHTYPAYVNYRFMRVFNALFGIALTPMAYITFRQLRLPMRFAAMAALFVTFDNAICVMSRFILLDAPLLGFTALALTMLACFYRQRSQPFSPLWWRYLLLTGVALGLVLSSKWIGLFAVALVGLYTIAELYEMFCNMHMPVNTYVRHWTARILALIVIPLFVYMLTFMMHFSVLNRYHGSANFMPMGFQVRLRGNPLGRQPYDIHTGSYVRLHSHDSGTGYLHSHEHKYPVGSQRQQITGYGYADPNNFWAIDRRMVAGSFNTAEDIDMAAAPIEGAIQDGDLVSMRHNSTSAYLYSESRFTAPMSSKYHEVSAVSVNSTEAKHPNIMWVVEVVNPEKRMKDGRIHPLGTPIRLRNAVSGCLLLSTGERLDKDWGWGQSEIACEKGGKPDEEHLWTIERHVNKNMKSTNLGQHMSSSFLRDFAVLNRQMWLTNNALIPDHDKHNVLESDPLTWPFMVYPMRMVGWDDRSIKYLEVGNPLLWWGSAVVCLVFPLQVLYWLACWKRGTLGNRWRGGELREYLEGALMLWGGWALHYLPFFLMGRVTYLHHYLPALYFGILFLVYQIYFVSSWYLNERSIRKVLYGSITLVAFVFWWFSPLTYGWDKPIKQLKGMQWASSWPVYEDRFEL
ncbi:Protein O-mannosyltransferase 2 [Coemansia interrupta]|uniref:Dolichyl-phosphate-mannose--protein mannosyltransferase n=1 Tax=Coemansia interrupta TaxID=1126814 RepID=A0A9W8LL02_9FUNG|nr:Protein O-mannosyltransferase 2 [Coemansia interrupta]